MRISVLNVKSEQQLFNHGDISEVVYKTSLLDVSTAEANYFSALANLSLLEKTHQDTRIISPISGSISRKFIESGSMDNPKMPVYRVVDLSE